MWTLERTWYRVLKRQDLVITSELIDDLERMAVNSLQKQILMYRPKAKSANGKPLTR